MSKYIIKVNGGKVLETDDFSQAINRYYRSVAHVIKNDVADKDQALDLFGDKVVVTNREALRQMANLGKENEIKMLREFPVESIEEIFKADPPTGVIHGLPLPEDMGQGESENGTKPRRQELKESEYHAELKTNSEQKPIEETSKPLINPASIMSKTNNLFEKSKVYLQVGKQPPKGEIIQRGSRGGIYYDSQDKKPIKMKENISIPAKTFETTYIRQGKIEVTNNPNILRGIYTFPFKWYQGERIKRTDEPYVKITVSPESRYFDNGADRPMDALRGKGNEQFKKIYNKILKDLKVTIDEVLDNWDIRRKFERSLETILNNYGIQIYQNGGETIILDPKVILKTEPFDRAVKKSKNDELDQYQFISSKPEENLQPQEPQKVQKPIIHKGYKNIPANKKEASLDLSRSNLKHKNHIAKDFPKQMEDPAIEMRSDLGRNKIGDTQEPISGKIDKFLKKASHSPDLGTKIGEKEKPIKHDSIEQGVTI